jgi:hypothetical protein
MHTPHDPRALFAAHLLEAGWSPLRPEPLGGLAMQRAGERLTLTLWYLPAPNLLRLRVAFPCGEASGGLLRAGEADLRMITAPSILPEVLERITAAERLLTPGLFPVWIEQLLGLCPETYAVISSPGAPEILALVTGASPAHAVLN